MQIIQGDCLEVLKTLPDQSVQTIVTSPPYYGLRDYGTAKWEGGSTECDHLETNDTRDPKITKQTQNAGTSKIGYKTVCHKCGAIRIDSQIGLEPTPDEYVAKLVSVFRECRRVLRDDGTLWLNLGDSYAGSGCGTNDYRTEASRSINKSDKMFTKTPPQQKIIGNGYKPKDLIGIPWRVAFALQADGWYLRSDIIWSKPNPMPESVKDRPTKAHEYIFLLAKSQRYYYDAEAVKEKVGEPTRRAKTFRNGGDYTGGNSFYNDSKKEKDSHGDGHESLEGRNKRSVWTVTTKPYREAHFATFPPDLIEPCVLAGCPAGGVVLDPFNGSGTTGAVALKHGRDYIGIELNPEYIELTMKRLSEVQPRLEVE